MRKILIDNFGCYTKIWIARSLQFVEERIDSSILKLVYNGINKENMPANLKLELKKPSRTLRNNSLTIFTKDKNMNKSIFIEDVNQIFKELPSSINQEICTMWSYSFNGKLKKYMFNRTLARVLLNSQIWTFCFVF